MSGDMMPKQQYDFIKGIQDNMLEASNMTEDDAWRFGFLIWQHQEWICKYLIDRKTEPTISKMEQVDEPKLTPNYCGTCKHREVPCGDLPCDVCHGYSNYEPKDEPQTDCAWK